MDRRWYFCESKVIGPGLPAVEGCRFAESRDVHVGATLVVALGRHKACPYGSRPVAQPWAGTRPAPTARPWHICGDDLRHRGACRGNPCGCPCGCPYRCLGRICPGHSGRYCRGIQIVDGGCVWTASDSREALPRGFERPLGKERLLRATFYVSARGLRPSGGSSKRSSWHSPPTWHPPSASRSRSRHRAPWRWAPASTSCASAPTRGSAISSSTAMGTASGTAMSGALIAIRWL